ncbi:MAG TPA: tetratricopeptide repeat protein [Candidatus Acidoferrales bacterium]|nr:tetratricopeptide repeat protein [Candidatus Acidoferrales bacterium]
MRIQLCKIAALSTLALMVAGVAAGQGTPPGPGPGDGMPVVNTGPGLGSLTVYVVTETGASLPPSADVQMRLRPTLSLFEDPLPLFPRVVKDAYLFDFINTNDLYDLEVDAKNYETAHKRIALQNTDLKAQSVIVFLKPVDETLVFQPPGGQFTLPPDAVKEVQSGLKDLQSNKFKPAQKQLKKALELAQDNPYVNYLMGMRFLLDNKASQAEPYLEKSVSADPRQGLALVALGNARYQRGDTAGAIRMLDQAVQLDPASWKAHWLLAESYLREKDYEKARTEAETALANGKDKASQVKLVLAEAMAGMGDREDARNTVYAFLVENPRYPDVAGIQTWWKQLAAAPAVSVRIFPKGPGSSPATINLPAPTLPADLALDLPPSEDWAPEDIDAEKPFVISNEACTLPKVLDAAANEVQKLTTDLQEFSATEDYEVTEVKRNKLLEAPEKRSFTYMVTIDDANPKSIRMEELRRPVLVASEMPGGIMDTGAPALVLAFHPAYRDAFQWTCEGLGEWNDRAAWVVRFQQKADWPTSPLSAFESDRQSMVLPFKGRAWVDVNAGEVVHMETDLVKPLPSIELSRQHIIVDYAPVSFKNHNVTLWLPEYVDLYMHYRTHYIHFYHHYSNFVLFWVGAAQKIGKPKKSTDQ